MPREGITRDELRRTVGIPWRSEGHRVGNEYWETYLYRRRQTVVMQGWGGARPTSHQEVDYFTVHLRDGIVVGGNW